MYFYLLMKKALIQQYLIEILILRFDILGMNVFLRQLDTKKTT